MTDHSHHNSMPDFVHIFVFLGHFKWTKCFLANFEYLKILVINCPNSYKFPYILLCVRENNNKKTRMR